MFACMATHTSYLYTFPARTSIFTTLSRKSSLNTRKTSNSGLPGLRFGFLRVSTETREKGNTGGGYQVYIDEPLKKYLDEAASGASTPGGGSVAALAGALGAALTSMVCNFTVGKKKYKDVEAEVSQILSEAEKLRGELLDLMVADTQVYGQVSAAYGMPRDTAEEKAARSAAIQDALKAAMGPPLEAAIRCHRIMKLNEPLVEKGNTNLISDVGVAILLAESAMRSAIMNVEINLSYIKDEALCEETREKLRPIIAEAVELRSKIYKTVNEAIGAELGA